MAAGTKISSKFSQRYPVFSGNLLHNVRGGAELGIRRIVKDQKNGRRNRRPFGGKRVAIETISKSGLGRGGS